MYVLSFNIWRDGLVEPPADPGTYANPSAWTLENSEIDQDQDHEQDDSLVDALLKVGSPAPSFNLTPYRLIVWPIPP